MLNIAIIGHGSLGKWHAEKVETNTSVNLCAIVDTNKNLLKNIQKKHPGTKVFESLQGLNLKEIHGVIVATPASTHYELVTFFLKNGIHVFCEKPLCTTLEEATKIGCFLSPNLVLQIGYSERFHLIWKILKEDLSKTTGPYLMTFNRFSPFKGRNTDIGVVEDLMTHDLDLLHFLFPDFSISEVRVKGRKQKTQYFDHVQAQIFFTDSSSAKLTADRNNVREERKVKIACKEGSFLVDLMNTKYVKSLVAENDANRHDPSTIIDYKKADYLDIEQKAFFEAILSKKPNPIDYYEGLKAVRLAQRINELLLL